MILIILLIYFLSNIFFIYSELAQLAEHLTVNQVVAGSSPAFGAKKKSRPRVCFFFLLCCCGENLHGEAVCCDQTNVVSA